MEVFKDRNTTFICISDVELKDLNNGDIAHNDNIFIVVKDDPKAFINNLKGKGWMKPSHLSVVE